MPADSGRIEISYAPSNPLTIYASIDYAAVPYTTTGPEADWLGELWKSTDGGLTFAPVNTKTYYLHTQGYYGRMTPAFRLFLPAVAR